MVATISTTMPGCHVCVCAVCSCVHCALLLSTDRVAWARGYVLAWRDIIRIASVTCIKQAQRENVETRITVVCCALWISSVLRGA